MRLVRALEARDWVRGAPRGRLIIEYGDFECPVCGGAYGELKRLLSTVGDQVGLVFRHFPMNGLHPHAQLAAEAAEAAGAQGRFWEMHDLLFEHQDALSGRALVGYAQALELDLEVFATDVREHRQLARIESDFLEGVRSGVHGTPTFFVDGVRYSGPPTAEGLLGALKEKAWAATPQWR